MAVMTGIDPHRRSHTAVALNGTDAVVGQLRVTADRRQLDRLLASPSRGPNACGRSRTPTAWDAMLSRQLLDAGEEVVDVPAKLSARVRALSGAEHKTDSHDARSTAVAGRTGTGGEGQLTDGLLGQVVEAVRPRRPSGHGAAWAACVAEHDRSRRGSSKNLCMRGTRTSASAPLGRRPPSVGQLHHQRGSATPGDDGTGDGEQPLGGAASLWRSRGDRSDRCAGRLRVTYSGGAPCRRDGSCSARLLPSSASCGPCRDLASWAAAS